jgi:hypothetical protein
MESFKMLPNEIINKIFLYLSSDTASVLKNSEFFGKSFPFFYLEQVGSIIPLNTIQKDFHSINQTIKQHRVDNKRYMLFHHFTNYKNIECLSEQTDIMYIFNSTRRYRLTNTDEMEEYLEDRLIDNLDYLQNIFT